jgi:hypothetical protein
VTLTDETTSTGGEASGNQQLPSNGREFLAAESEQDLQTSQDLYYVSDNAPRYASSLSRRSQFSQAGCQGKSTSPDWDKMLESMTEEIIGTALLPQDPANLCPVVP